MPDYLTSAELKATLSLTGETFADADIALAITSASRTVEQIAGRRFYPDADANQVRYYTPCGSHRLVVDDLVTLTSLKTDRDGNGTFEETWTLNTDFLLEPLNAVADGVPWSVIRRHPQGTKSFPYQVKSVELTGKFGWAAAPEPVKKAAGILAAKFVLIARQAPFGVVNLGPDSEAFRIARSDPHVMGLLSRYIAVPTF